jgi:hypothetical protein
VHARIGRIARSIRRSPARHAIVGRVPHIVSNGLDGPSFGDQHPTQGIRQLDRSAHVERPKVQTVDHLGQLAGEPDSHPGPDPVQTHRHC